MYLSVDLLIGESIRYMYLIFVNLVIFESDIFMSSLIKI